ncbi:MAG: 2-oxo acid dehydrogenase subunit E2 [Thermoplasmatota archaeon]
MNDRIGEFRVQTFPSSRISTFDVVAIGLEKHHIKALVEVDVTEARKRITQLKERDVKVSFNSWLIKCIGEAVAGFDRIHGIRKGKRKVVIFRDVDISILIEREVNGQKVPLPYVVRKANKKSIEQIFDEVRSGKDAPVKDEGDNVLGDIKCKHICTRQCLEQRFLVLVRRTQ